MFAGRKLLVVDDSPYYRTVIGLTFTDEGMEVTTAGDSFEALERLERSTPDVVLANVSLPGIGPGINGYELCERIKQSEQFGHIPVMLLVGLHEVFDRAEARRVGADDVVTKPFKSIRELVGRVGSLLGGQADTGDAGYEHSTLGLGRADVAPAPATNEQTMTESDVKVFIEAPSMTEHEPFEPVVEPAGSVCVADVELQTADTQKLEHPVHTAPDDPDVKMSIEAPSMTEHEPLETSAEPAGSTSLADVELQTADTQELERIDDEPAAETMEPISHARDETQPPFSDALLDLDYFNVPAQVAGSEDLILDLEYEEPESEPTTATPEIVSTPAAAFEAAPSTESAESIVSEVSPAVPTHEEQHVAELQEWSIVTEAPPQSTPMSVAPEQESSDARTVLSPGDIDAIARRVVEQLSDKVVREIAWEVVPELAELLIKNKLDEQK